MSRSATALIATPLKAVGELVSIPSTPATLPKEIVPPSPGTFRHPRVTEIIQRQSAASLNSRKIQNAFINITAILLTFIFGSTLDQVLSKALTTAAVPSSAFDAPLCILLLRILFFANTIVSLRPILPYISQKDDVTDIPLTPSQRALLGLPSSNQSSPLVASGSTGYVTPPRYRRDGGVNASTSLQNSPLGFSTGRRSISANYSSSPISTSRHAIGFSPSPQQNNTQSARTYRRTSDSPFAGSASGSPLFHKAITNDISQSTGTGFGRSSFGASSTSFGIGLNRSQSLRERKGALEDTDSLPGTPSPSGPKRQRGVNYKWLYDKGARMPRSESTGF